MKNEDLVSFSEELEELFSRYSTRMLTPDVMHITQKLLRKYFSFKNNPLLQSVAENYLRSIDNS